MPKMVTVEDLGKLTNPQRAMSEATSMGIGFDVLSDGECRVWIYTGTMSDTAFSQACDRIKEAGR